MNFKSLTMYVGPMFAGKSTKLIQEYKECTASKFFGKFTLGPCSKNEEIKTHGNIKQVGNLIKSLNDIPGDTDVLFLDEVQFVQDWSNFHDLCQDKIIYMSGLDRDSIGNVFEDVVALMGHATYVYKIHGTCPNGFRTEFSLRQNKDINKSRLVETSGEEFTPVCRKCFYLGRSCKNDNSI